MFKKLFAEYLIAKLNVINGKRAEEVNAAYRSGYNDGIVDYYWETK